VVVRHGDEVVGGGGRVADAAVDAPAWAGEVWMLEARLPTEGAAPAGRRYRAIPEQPATERDLALLTPIGVESARVEEAIRGAAGELLEWIGVFDVYEGPGVADGFRSVAWRLRFRAADRTLTDAEVDPVVARVLAALEDVDVRRR
jgi:phenylalanyl-tRNA synthetase beta chain